MEKYHGAAVSSTGPAIPGATVTVYDFGTTDLSAIYSDNGVTPAANPLTTGADGEYSFYAADGRYTLVTAKTGFVTDTRTDVLLGSGSGSGIQNYQFDCSDLGSDIVATTDAGYFRTQTAVSFSRVRGSLLYPSVTGPVEVEIRNRATNALVVSLSFAQGVETAETTTLLITDFADNSILAANIITPGVGAKGLQMAMVGAEIDGV
jgi:hypothetical protein